MFHIIQEAKRTVPSVLYIPHLLRLWRNVLSIPQREAFMALLSEIAPTAPLIIIAFTGMYGLMFKKLLQFSRLMESLGVSPIGERPPCLVIELQSTRNLSPCLEIADLKIQLFESLSMFINRDHLQQQIFGNPSPILIFNVILDLFQILHRKSKHRNLNHF